MDYNFKQILRQVNQDISEIKNFGLQPITLKSPANIIEKLIQPKGTSAEGEFKTYEQYISEYGYISEQEYSTYVMDFIADYHEQLNLKGAVDYQLKWALANLEGRVEDDVFSRIETLTKEELIRLIQMAGEDANETVRNGGYSDIFYYFIEQYLGDYFDK